MEKLKQVGATSEGHKESQSEAKTAKTGKTAKLKKQKTCKTGEIIQILEKILITNHGLHHHHLLIEKAAGTMFHVKAALG